MHVTENRIQHFEKKNETATDGRSVWKHGTDAESHRAWQDNGDNCVEFYVSLVLNYLKRSLMTPQKREKNIVPRTKVCVSSAKVALAARLVSTQVMREGKVGYPLLEAWLALRGSPRAAGARPHLARLLQEAGRSGKQARRAVSLCP